jgi:hypothetical protein
MQNFDIGTSKLAFFMFYNMACLATSGLEKKNKYILNLVLQFQKNSSDVAADLNPD